VFAVNIFVIDLARLLVRRIIYSYAMDDELKKMPDDLKIMWKEVLVA
jgi:hypothetical protein